MKFLTPWNKDRPTSLPWGGWTKWKNEQKAKYPVRFFFFDTIPDYFRLHAWWPLQRVKWWVLHRIHPQYRYHIVKTGLKPGYYDPDIRILHTCMNIFKEFVEVAGPQIAWDSSESHAKAWKEMKEIYEWWVNKYPIREQNLLNFPKIDHGKLFGGTCDDNDPEVKEWQKVADIRDQSEIEWANEEEEMLTRLMEVRKFLWYP